MLIGDDYTYSGDPSTSDKDRVRFLIPDTDPDDMLLSDTEIDWLLDENKDFYSAAAEAAELAGYKYARTINRQEGGLNLSLGQNNPYLARAKELRAKIDGKVAPAFANKYAASLIASHGGVRPPLFWIGQHDGPRPNTWDGMPRDWS